jgi:hypothetical protein
LSEKIKAPLEKTSRGLLDGRWRQGPLEALLFLGTY